jgi:hypothetical protein
MAIVNDGREVVTIYPEHPMGAAHDQTLPFLEAIFLTGLVVAAASSSWLADSVGLEAAMLLAGLGFAAGYGISSLLQRIACDGVGRRRHLRLDRTCGGRRKHRGRSEPPIRAYHPNPLFTSQPARPPVATTTRFIALESI